MSSHEEKCLIAAALAWKDTRASVIKEIEAKSLKDMDGTAWTRLGKAEADLTDAVKNYSASLEK